MVIKCLNKLFIEELISTNLLFIKKKMLEQFQSLMGYIILFFFFLDVLLTMQPQFFFLNLVEALIQT